MTKRHLSAPTARAGRRPTPCGGGVANARNFPSCQVMSVEEGWHSACISESDDAEIMDVAAATATEGWAIGRDRAHVSTTIEKAGRYSAFFLHYDGKPWQDYDVAAELPKLATLGRDRPGGTLLRQDARGGADRAALWAPRHARLPGMDRVAFGHVKGGWPR